MVLTDRTWGRAWQEAEAIVQRWLDAYPEDVFPPITPGDVLAGKQPTRDQVVAHMARHMAREILRQFAEARRG
jgi:hypothetical protein